MLSYIVREIESGHVMPDVSRKMTGAVDERFQPLRWIAPTATTGKFRSDPGLRIVSVSQKSWTLLGVLIFYCPSSSLLFK